MEEWEIYMPYLREVSKEHIDRTKGKQEPEAFMALRQACRNFWATSMESSEEDCALAEMQEREKAVPEEQAWRLVLEEAERVYEETGKCPFHRCAQPYLSDILRRGLADHPPQSCRLAKGCAKGRYKRWCYDDTFIGTEEYYDFCEIAGILQEGGCSYIKSGRLAAERLAEERKQRKQRKRRSRPRLLF